MNFYKTKAWQKKTNVIKRRDGYQCQECKRYGKSVDATTIHHIYPADEYPNYVMCNDNLISLCSACHNKMHDRLTNKITKKGQEWQKRVKHKIFKIKN